MAGKGLYGAYQAQPQTPSPQFEGEAAFARMAAVTAQKRAEERAEQRKLAGEMRQAVSNAVEAGNVDLSTINTSVHSVVGKMMDSYGEKLTDAMESMGEEYSFEKQMEVNKLRTNFQSNIGSVMGLGEKIKSIQTGKWDPVMSLEPLNANTRFLLDLPSMLDKFDPDTMTVDGVPLVELHSQKVDMSKLIEPLDTNSVFIDMQKRLQDTPERTTRQQGGFDITYDEFSYDPGKVRSIFRDNFSGTDEDKKQRAILLREYEDMSPEERDNFPYVSLDGDGQPFVSETNVLDFFQDNYLPERVEVGRKQREEKPVTAPRTSGMNPEELQQGLGYIDQAFTAQGMQNLVGMELQIGASKASLESGQVEYDWMTGQPKTQVWYKFKSGAGMMHGVEAFDINNVGRQKLGNFVYGGDLDYIKVAGEIGHTPDYRPLDFSGRKASIEKQAKNLTDNVMTAYREAKELGEKTHTSTIGGITETLAQFGVYNAVISEYVTEDLSKKKGFFVASAFENDAYEQKLAVERIVYGAMASQAMLEEGLSKAEIKPRLDKLLTEYGENYLETAKGINDFGFKFDGLERRIQANIPTNKRTQAFAEADEFIKYNGQNKKPVTDAEVWAHVNGVINKGQRSVTQINPNTIPFEDLKKTIFSDPNIDEKASMAKIEQSRIAEEKRTGQSVDPDVWAEMMLRDAYSQMNKNN
jgi:hypothetical protein